MEVTNADGGYRYRIDLENLYFYLGDFPYREGNYGAVVAAGGRWATGWDISGVPNYSKGSTDGVIKIIRRAGGGEEEEIGRCTIDVIDDDNTAYIGGLKAHPYGGTWQTTPKCYGPPKCAWD